MDADGGNVRLLTDGPAPAATPTTVCSGGALYCGYAEACWSGGGEVGSNTPISACSHANMIKGGTGGTADAALTEAIPPRTRVYRAAIL